MPLKTSKPLLVELAREVDPNIISRESDTYKRIYTLLEQNTFSWITDAWQKRPALDAIERLPLKQFTREQAIKIAAKNGLDEAKAISSCAQRQSYALIRVNDRTVMLLDSVATQIINLIDEHVV